MYICYNTVSVSLSLCVQNYIIYTYTIILYIHIYIIYTYILYIHLQYEHTQTHTRTHTDLLSVFVSFVVRQTHGPHTHEPHTHEPHTHVAQIFSPFLCLCVCVRARFAREDVANRYLRILLVLRINHAVVQNAWIKNSGTKYFTALFSKYFRTNSLFVLSLYIDSFIDFGFILVCTHPHTAKEPYISAKRAVFLSKVPFLLNRSASIPRSTLDSF